jgi:hypothetical protein
MNSTIVLISNFFILSGIIGGFIVTILLTVSSKKFLKGDVRNIIELLLCGNMFLYSFLLTQFLIDAFGLKGGYLEIFKGIFIYLMLIYFIFAGVYIFEISKSLGFASEKVSKKLKKILEE